MKLGAIHRTQPLAVRPLSKRARLDLMIPPPTVDWHIKCPADHDPLGNDRYGCCCEVADYRIIQMHRAVICGDTTKPLVSDILARYTALTGFNPVTGQPDDGTDTVSDMTAWSTQGIHVADQTIDVPMWTLANPADQNEVNLAIANCGPILVTLALPLAAQDLTAWSKPIGTGPDWAPYSWGGHRVICGKYDGLVRTVRTWGIDVPLHPAWWSAYVVGVDVLLSREWINTTGLSPSGLDWDALKADMASL
jgi:hypothetical protein